MASLSASATVPPAWRTVYVSGGRRDKISKGDIAGLFFKQGGLSREQLGVIELQQGHAYAGVHAEAVEGLVAKTNNTKLKRKKVRVSVFTASAAARPRAQHPD